MIRMEDKRLYDINDPRVHKLFLSVQNKRGIKSGDVEPFWVMMLSLKMEKKGITEKELRKEIEGYYDIHEIGI